MINYSRQLIYKDDINSVIQVLKSNYLTQGPKVSQFEKNISNYCNSKFAVAVNSATSGLHIACLSLGLKKNDIVWTSAISFVASANCALYCGAKIDFLDISLNNFNLDIDLLEKKLETARRKKQLPKIIIIVHFAGLPCDMKKIYKLKKKFKFKIIEDASHALGAKYFNNKVGNCKFSELCVFSFHPVKPITTGEGGVVTTNKKKIYQKLNLYREHGIKRITSKKTRPKYYEQISLGYNYRMNDLQAALGIQQLKKLNAFNNIRDHLFNRYEKKLNNVKIIKPKKFKNFYSTNHLYIILLKADKIKYRDKVLKKLIMNKIGCNIHYMPIYKHPFYNKKKYKNLKNSELFYKNCISIPLHQSLKYSQQDKIINILNKVIK
tara:strand:+ start:2572 stop:3708 length:1137 start_codon:yes stop_codon:yes gene_type:complete